MHSIKSILSNNLNDEKYLTDITNYIHFDFNDNRTIMNKKKNFDTTYVFVNDTLHFTEQTFDLFFY